MRRFSISLLLVFTTPGLLLASGWSSIGSDHRELEDYRILAVGELTQRRHFDYESSQVIEWFEFSESYGSPTCIVFVGLEPMILGDKAALIVVDDKENLKLALIESSVGNIKISLERISASRCPPLP